MLFGRLLIFFQNQLFRKILSIITSVSNSLDLDLGQHFLQRLSAEEASKQRVKHACTAIWLSLMSEF